MILLAETAEVSTARPLTSDAEMKLLTKSTASAARPPKPANSKVFCLTREVES
jgi:hypothetical protein